MTQHKERQIILAQRGDPFAALTAPDLQSAITRSISSTGGHVIRVSDKPKASDPPRFISQDRSNRKRETAIKPAPLLRRGNKAAVPSTEKIEPAHKKLPCLSVQFNNVMFIEARRTCIGAETFRAYLPDDLARQYEAYVAASKEQQEMRMTAGLLGFAQSFYRALPSWEDPARISEAAGIQFGESEVDVYMSRRTAEVQIKEAFRQYCPDRQAVMQHMLTKGFSEASVKEILNGSIHASVSRKLVATALQAIISKEPV